MVEANSAEVVVGVDAVIVQEVLVVDQAGANMDDIGLGGDQPRGLGNVDHYEPQQATVAVAAAEESTSDAALLVRYAFVEWLYQKLENRNLYEVHCSLNDAADGMAFAPAHPDT